VKKIILILLTLTSIAFAQEMQGQEKILNKYLLMLDKHKNAYIKDLAGSIDSTQLMDIAKEIYAVYQKIPKITYERMWAYYDENNKNRDTIDYPRIEYMFKKEIEKRFGKEYFNILRTPYTFKIKVLKKNLVEYFWTYKKFTTVITAQIEYILCGENFEIGDIIEFYCYKDKIYDFEINKSYIVPLEYSYTKNRKLNGLFLAQKGLECVDGYVLDKDLKLKNKAKINFEDLKTLYHNAINLLGENSK